MTALDAAYRRLHDQEGWQPDPVQDAVVARLTEVAHNLDGFAGKGSGLFSRLVGAKQEMAPKGLYLWGGVGRGKTMLMDMFFANLPQRGASATGWRLHFHDFMVLAQDLIHEARARNEADPIAAAAAKLAAKGDVLCFDEMEVRDIADAMIVARLFTSI
ncbi:MAG: cell division protein ZapE, partial [Alphaproteobacteria bacterium]